MPLKHSSTVALVMIALTFIPTSFQKAAPHRRSPQIHRVKKVWAGRIVLYGTISYQDSLIRILTILNEDVQVIYRIYDN